MILKVVYQLGALALEGLMWAIDYGIDSTPAAKRAKKIRDREAFIREWTDGTNY